MRTAKEKRAVKARSKMLKARADAQAFNQSIWSTVALRHGAPASKFDNHGTYSEKGLTKHQKQGMGGHNNDK
jgi:hypothetical protein